MDHDALAGHRPANLECQIVVEHLAVELRLEEIGLREGSIGSEAETDMDMELESDGGMCGAGVCVRVGVNVDWGFFFFFFFLEGEEKALPKSKF